MRCAWSPGTRSHRSEWVKGSSAKSVAGQANADEGAGTVNPRTPEVTMNILAAAAVAGSNPVARFDLSQNPATPNNQRLSAAQRRKLEARTSIAADKPCWTEPPVMRWCELFLLLGI